MVDSVEAVRRDKAATGGDKPRLWLEIVKLSVSLAALGSILVGVYQLSETRKLTEISTKTADLNLKTAIAGNYEKLAGRWGDHLEDLSRQPGLRPFFTDGMPVPESGELRQKVLAFADLRLDLEDGVLTLLTAYDATSEAIAGWRNTFAKSFRTSPALCSRFLEDREFFGLLKEIGDKECRARS